MPVEVTMPQMGESVVEGTIAKWLVKEGDRVTEDQPLVEISTDKVDTEIPAPGAGVISKIIAQEGQTLLVDHRKRVERRGGPRPPPQKRSRAGGGGAGGGGGARGGGGPAGGFLGARAAPPRQRAGPGGAPFASPPPIYEPREGDIVEP